MTNDKPKIEYRCPQCHRFLIDRRRKKCMWCGAALPPELLFTNEELEKIKNELAEIQEERRQRELRDKKIKNKRGD